MKKITLAVIIVAFCAVTAAGITFFPRRGAADVPTEYIDTVFAFDMDDLRKVVGSKSYVFAAEVLSVKDALSELSREELPARVAASGSAYTRCILKLIRNIKGELSDDEEIVLWQAGGLSADRKKRWMYEKEPVIEQGGRYIFTAVAWEDGCLVGGGYNSTRVMTEGIDDLEKDPAYIEFVEAYNDQIIPDTAALFPSFICNYDVNYTPGYNDKLTVQATSPFESVTEAETETLFEVKDIEPFSREFYTLKGSDQAIDPNLPISEPPVTEAP